MPENEIRPVETHNSKLRPDAISLMKPQPVETHESESTPKPHKTEYPELITTSYDGTPRFSRTPPPTKLEFLKITKILQRCSRRYRRNLSAD